MEIKWLKTFVVTAKYENFRKSSEELFLTQPGVTKHIKRLEDNLNIQLFDRIGHKVVLTPAGHKFLTYAKDLLQNYEQSMTDFESWKQGYNRTLTIATAPQIASSVLPSILRNFMNHYPDIEVLINVVQSFEIGEEISAGRADLGLSRILPVQTNIKTETVHEESVILVCPSENDEKQPLTEQDVLQKYRLITHNHPDYWDDLLNDVKRFYPNVRTMKVNQIEVTKRFIEERLGISYLPLTMVNEEINMNKITAVQPDKIIPPKSSTFVLTKVETAETIMFIQFLKESIMIG